MAELPGWRASISTNMPTKEAILRPGPAKVQPRVMKFIATDDPNNYMKIAQAEANKYEAISDTALSVVDVGIKIVEESETAEVNRIGAEHAEELGRYTTAVTSDKRLYTWETNPDGTTSKVYHWETAERDFDAFTNEYKQKVLDKRKFRTKKARSLLEDHFSTNNKSNRTKVQKFVGERRIDKGQADLMERAEIYKKTNNMSGLEMLYHEGVQSGLYDAKVWRTYLDGVKKDTTYTNYAKLLGEVEIMVDNGDISAADYDVVAGSYHRAILEDPNLKGEHIRKLDGMMDDMDEQYEDRITAAQERNTELWMRDYTLNVRNRGHMVNDLRTEDPSRLRNRYGDGIVDIMKRVETEITVGTKDRDKAESIQQDINEYRLGQTDKTYKEIQSELAALRIDESRMIQLTNSLTTAAMEKQSDAADDFKDALARALTRDGIDYKTLEARINRGQNLDPDDEAAFSRINNIYGENRDGILARPNQRWDVIADEEVVNATAESFPFMYDASGQLTTDPERFDPKTTIKHVEKLESEYRAFKLDDKSWLEDHFGEYRKAGTPGQEGHAELLRRWESYARAHGVEGPITLDAKLPDPGQNHGFNLRRKLNNYSLFLESFKRRRQREER